MQGRSVRLYLVDGSPTGLLTAEIMNWTGHVLVAPRSRIGEALQREEATRTGVYFLVGDDPDQPTKARVYVGEGDSVADRIKSHDRNKDFWTHACIVTSKDMNLTKAHVRYLENRFVELTRAAGRANLGNGNDPGRKSLPEADIADMEFFIGQVQIVLPVVGFDFLRPKPQVSHQPSTATTAPKLSDDPSGLELVLESNKHELKARAVGADGDVTVLTGSQALKTASEIGNNGYAVLRAQLIQEARLKPTDDPKYLVFAEDVTFASPSAAAAVIMNRNTNGRTAWKLAATGQTLKDWQDSQLGASQP